jgi:hypothetical protein
MAECHGRPALHNSPHHPSPPKYTIAATVIPAAQTYYHCSSFHSSSLSTFILSDPSPHALLDPRSTCPFVIHFTQPILDHVLNAHSQQSERERERKLTPSLPGTSQLAASDLRRQNETHGTIGGARPGDPYFSLAHSLPQRDFESRG